MGLSRLALGCFLAAVLASGCPSEGAPRDGSPPTDSGATPDGSPPTDGSSTTDGRPPDAGPVDEVISVDVVVVGAGTGGVAAALAAARRGVRVALIEETDWVGGQATAAAVSSMDGGYADPDNGVYGELIARVRARYGSRPIGTCYWRSTTFCFEPSVGQSVMREMLGAEGGIQLHLRTRVDLVLSSTAGGRTTVTGLRATRRTSGAPDEVLLIEAAVVVDATEYGDVIALSPARYRVGNSTSDAVDAGACVQDMTYVAVIRRHASGPPAELRITAPPPGYTPERVAAFARIITATGTDGFSSGGYPYNWPTHNAYRGMPNSLDPTFYTAEQRALISKTGVNWANDYPVSVRAIEDRAARRETECAAKLRTLQFLYYVQNDLGQPLWTVAPEEGFDTPFNTEDNACPGLPAELRPLERHFPVMPYVREARRLVGVRTLTGSDIKRVGSPPMAARRFPTSIAVGDYADDLHACNCDTDGPAVLEAGLDACDDVPAGFVGGPFQVPLEVLLPETVDGLVAAEKNLSVSRLVNGAIRLQPITMATGEAAGVVAALSAIGGVPPRALRAIDVQTALVRANLRIAVQGFTDVARADPYWPDVQIAAAHEVMTGNGVSLFRPTAQMPRDEGAVAIARMLGLPIGSPPAVASFNDVPTTHWAFAAIEALLTAGLTTGCRTMPLEFCPDGPLTRAQLAVILGRGLGLDPAGASTTPHWTDVPASHGAFGWIQAFTEAGLGEACGAGATQFCPDSPILRQEAARVVALTLLRTGG